MVMNAAMTVPPQERAAIVKRAPRQTGLRRPQELVLPGLRLQILSNEPVLLLSGETIVAAARAPTRRRLINRLFSITSLRSLRLNWRKGEVRLEFSPASIGEVLAALALAMRGGPAGELPLLHEEVIGGDKGPSAFEIRRLGAGLTLWRVDSLSTRVYRLTHPLLRSEFVRKEVLNELSTLSEVVHPSLSVLFSGGDSLLVFVMPHRIDPTVFQEVLDPVLTRCLSTRPTHRAPVLRGLMVNTNLMLAPLADFLFPPLGMVNLALTTLISLKYLPRALFSLRKGKFTVELLYLASAIFTGLTFQFLPAAVMYWLLRFWPRRTGQLYDLHQSKFLARYRRRPRRVWVERDGASVETRVEELTPSTLVTLTAGDIVPGDGVIVSGTAQIDERLLTGSSNSVPKIKGNPIYAASRLLDGTVRIKIKSLGDNTAVARIALWQREALERQDAQHQAADLADQTALPILLVGAAALVYGGFSMAKATIRPDYMTGPAISEKMSGLAKVIRAANEGILIAENLHLEKLLKCDSIVFDDSVKWRAPENSKESFSRMVLKEGLDEVVFFASGSSREAAKQAENLGFEAFEANGDRASKRAYIAERQKLGHSVIYVGDCATESAAANQANVAISVLEPPYRQANLPPLVLLSPDLMKFLQLHAIAVDAIKEFKIGFGLSLAPNLAAVFGALFLASPISVSVLLTSLGMLADYVRAGTILHLAERAER
jgi:hypothetical protein